MALESIRYSNGKLEILDQLLLPAQNKYLNVKGVEDGWKVINRMQVRGAPAIAIVGCLSLAVEIFNEQFSDKKSLRQEIEGKLNYLVSARPTAVNVSYDIMHQHVVAESINVYYIFIYVYSSLKCDMKNIYEFFWKELLIFFFECSEDEFFSPK